MGEGEFPDILSSGGCHSPDLTTIARFVLVPTLYLQRRLNLYWKKSKFELLERPVVSGGFVPWSIAGVLLWSASVFEVWVEIGTVVIE